MTNPTPVFRTSDCADTVVGYNFCFSFKEKKAVLTATSLVAPGSFARAKVAIAPFPGVFPRLFPTENASRAKFSRLTR
jgi:hypothetical protein